MTSMSPSHPGVIGTEKCALVQTAHYRCLAFMDAQGAWHAVYNPDGPALTVLSYEELPPRK